LGQYSFSGTYAYIIGTLTAGITAFYSFRLISLVFLTEPNGSKITYLNSHESNLTVIIPLFCLAVFSIFFGFVFSDLFVGIGTDFFGNSIFSHPNNISIIESEFSLPILLKLLPTLFSLTGALLALYLYQKNTISLITITETKRGKKLYTFLNGKYFFDILYNNYIISNGLHLGYYISKGLDRGIIELIGPFGLSTLFIKTSKNIAKLDTGIITTYALYITLAFLSLLFLVFAPFLIDTSLLNEIRLFIIYIASLLLIL
jgi:NADH-ubiquinone oxidoreductase chain 5